MRLAVAMARGSDAIRPQICRGARELPWKEPDVSYTGLPACRAAIALGGPACGAERGAGDRGAAVCAGCVRGHCQDADRGSQIVSGDEIRTGSGGLVQILFPDETKIVVGPGSTLRIDDTLFRNNGTARRFSTTAIGGSFRFISGKSNKDVYKLATPLATMGIRGTAFDFTVTRKSQYRSSCF